MSRKEIFASRGLDQQGVEKTGRSFEGRTGDVCTVDRELDRLFHEFWEGADHSKSLSSRRKRRKLSADAGCKAGVDLLVGNGTSKTEGSTGPE